MPSLLSQKYHLLQLSNESPFDNISLTRRCKTDQVVNADRRMNKLEFHIGEGVRMFWLLFHPLFPISSVLSCLFVYIFGKAAAAASK